MRNEKLLFDYINEYCEKNPYLIIAKDFSNPNDVPDKYRGKSCSEDESPLAKSFYYYLWDKNLLPNNDYFNYYYGGDTINSYTNLFGSDDSFNVEKELSKEFPKFKCKLEIFKKKVYTIGNFMPLPKGSRGKSLNTYRNNRYRDYFDIFLYELDKVLRKDKNQDENLKDIIISDERSNDYFKIHDNIKEFCKNNFLSKYLINGKPELKFSEHLTSFDARYSKDKYIAFANEYIDKVIYLIYKRAIIMIDKLVEKYPNEFNCKNINKISYSNFCS